MKYSSKNGCLYYYDSVLYKWQIAEPTLLFLLGLEAVTSYSKSQSDKITISKYIYNINTDSLIPLEYIDDLYDNIYSFLSKFGSIEDFENYIKFNCFGLKLFLNTLTGINDDRTVPIIFKSDVNKNLINQLAELPIILTENNSFYDIQAECIYNIFTNVGYDNNLKDISRSNNEIDLTVLETIFPDDFTNTDRIPIRKDVRTYNNATNKIHTSLLTICEVYKLLDYKAMYAYSLGVLFGCRCIGYSDSVIWRIDPISWYTDKYLNLVRTAWYVFRFHWANAINDLEDKTISENYASIQDNKLWNFDNNNEQLLYGAPIASDELDCTQLYAEGELVKSQNIVYSYKTNILATQEYPGSYLVYNNNQWQYKSIDELISDSIPEKGIISLKSTPLIRYIGMNSVILFKAYSYIASDGLEHYLAPKYINADTLEYSYKKYFCFNGALGWVDYNPNLIKDFKHYTEDLDNNKSYNVHDYLYVIPQSVDLSKSHYAKLKDTSAESQPVITYFKYYVTDHSTPIPSSTEYDDNDSDILYGIYKKYINSRLMSSAQFDLILSKQLFDELYDTESIVTDTIEDYNEKTFYDLNASINLLVRYDSNTSLYYIWNGDNDPSNDENVFKFGYSETPSALIELYIKNDENPNIVTFRYNNEYNKYWINRYTTWKTIDQLDTYDTVYYKKLNNTINIFRGEEKLLNNAASYNKIADINTNVYIYNNKQLFNLSIDTDYDFILVDNPSDLYNNGYTTNLCEYVLIDDNGNSLLDDNNNPLVWYDPKYNKYWNGLNDLNQWQDEKPYRNIT